MSPVGAAILEFLKVYIDEHGWAPSIREIGDAVGLRSTSSASWQLRNLQDAGLIERVSSKSRTIRITEEAA